MRQAFWAKRTPASSCRYGPVDEQNVLILSHHSLADSVAGVAIEPARMLVIDIFDHTALSQLGVPQASRQRAISFQAIADRRHCEALLRSRVGWHGGSICHGKHRPFVQLMVCSFSNRGLIQHVIPFWSQVVVYWQNVVVIVVVGTAYVLVPRPGLPGSNSSVVAGPVTLQNGSQTGIGTGLQVERPRWLAASSRHSSRSWPTQDSEAGAIAHFRIAPAGEDSFGSPRRGGSNRFAQWKSAAKRSTPIAPGGSWACARECSVAVATELRT